MQQLVNDIRAVGYTNPIIANRRANHGRLSRIHWITSTKAIIFTLLLESFRLYLTPQHRRSKGIKLINTEVGADSREYRYFTNVTVDELNTFLNQSASLGVGNCVWMNYNLNNWPTYQSLGLEFQTASTPISQWNVSLQSEEEDDATSN